MRLLTQGQVARRLRDLRSHRGWTQAELAKKTGIMQSSICSYETEGSLPGRRNRRALAKVFGIPELDLVVEADDEGPTKAVS